MGSNFCSSSLKKKHFNHFFCWKRWLANMDAASQTLIQPHFPKKNIKLESKLIFTWPSFKIMFENFSDLFQFALPEHLPPSDEKQMELWKDKFSQVKSQRLRINFQIQRLPVVIGKRFDTPTTYFYRKHILLPYPTFCQSIQKSTLVTLTRPMTI